MDFTEKASIDAADSIIDHPEGFQIVCDPKSLLYLFGMQLDYSTELIGGGFQFKNPNAESSCGCGKSFSA
jgi:iron-sulfur cluster assembly protein